MPTHRLLLLGSALMVTLVIFAIMPSTAGALEVKTVQSNHYGDRMPVTKEEEDAAIPANVKPHIRDEKERRLFLDILYKTKSMNLDLSILTTSLGRLITTLMSFQLTETELNAAVQLFCRVLRVAPNIPRTTAEQDLPWLSAIANEDASLLQDIAANTFTVGDEFMKILRTHHVDTSRREFLDAYGVELSGSIADAIAAYEEATNERKEDIKTSTRGGKDRSAWEDSLKDVLYNYQQPRWMEFCRSAKEHFGAFYAEAWRPHFGGIGSHVDPKDEQGAWAAKKALQYPQDEGNMEFQKTFLDAVELAVKQLNRKKRVTIIGAENLEHLGLLQNNSRGRALFDSFMMQEVVDENAAAVYEEFRRFGFESQSTKWAGRFEDPTKMLCPLLHSLHRAIFEAKDPEHALAMIREVFLRFGRVPHNSPKHLITVKDSDLLIVNDALSGYVPALLHWTFQHFHDFRRIQKQHAEEEGKQVAEDEDNLPDALKNFDVFKLQLLDEAEFLADYLAEEFVKTLARDVPQGSVIIFVSPVRDCTEVHGKSEDGTSTTSERVNCFRSPGRWAQTSRALSSGESEVYFRRFDTVRRRPIRPHPTQQDAKSSDPQSPHYSPELPEGTASSNELQEVEMYLVRRGYPRPPSEDEFIDFGEDVQRMIEEEQRMERLEAFRREEAAKKAAEVGDDSDL